MANPYIGIYSSSKAAMIQLSEILRVELAPLGVRVITAMVGAVTTPIHDKAGELNLPPGSYYQQIRDLINDIRKGSSKPGSQDVNVVAKNLVHDIIGGRSGLIWRGGTSSLSGYLSWLLPVGFWEKVVNGGRGLDQVKLEQK